MKGGSFCSGGCSSPKQGGSNTLPEFGGPASRTRVLDAQAGLTLLETLIILGVLMILLGAVAPLLINQVTQARANQVIDEMRALHEAMVGDDEAGTFGYVGDMGRLPTDLTELAAQGQQQPPAASPVHGVSTGWNGPYVSIGVESDDYRTDPWGNGYRINDPGPGQVHSAGPNGRFDDGDDVVYPSTAVNVFGSLLVLAKGAVGDIVTTNPEGCTVTLGFSADGVESSVVDDTPPFSFTSVHRGLHGITVSCPDTSGGTATATSAAAVVGMGQQQLVEVFLRLGDTLAPATGEATEEPGIEEEDGP